MTKNLIKICRVKVFAACLAAVSFVPAFATAATFNGEFWDVSDPNTSIEQALLAVDGIAPTATFTSTSIDYPNGDQNIQFSSGTLANFLGADAASIVGDSTASITTSVFRFTGFVELTGEQSFALGSDDGYRLTLNNTVVSQQNTPRGFRFTTLSSDVGTGVVPFELIFYENFGRTGVEFFIDGGLAAAVVAPVPLPNTLSLGLAGLAALGLMGWRRRPSQKIPLATPA